MWAINRILYSYFLTQIKGPAVHIGILADRMLNSMTTPASQKPLIREELKRQMALAVSYISYLYSQTPLTQNLLYDIFQSLQMHERVTNGSIACSRFPLFSGKCNCPIQSWVLFAYFR